MGKIKVGETIYKNSKQGGGSYLIVGEINCSRCNTLIEEREVLTPNRGQRKRGSYYSRYSWCWKCKLYENLPSTKVIL